MKIFLFDYESRERKKDYRKTRLIKICSNNLCNKREREREKHYFLQNEKYTCHIALIFSNENYH